MFGLTDPGDARALGEALRAGAAATEEHCAQVVRLGLAIADELGIDAQERRLVELGALLNDVGKVVIPNEILEKAGPLDDEEWAIVRRHTIAGQELIEEIGGRLVAAGAVVRASHERWDGLGYPDGLVGEAIPLAARIVAVADAHSAMTAERPYRRARPPSEARRELRASAGTQFDPAVVDAVLAVLARG